MSGADFAITFLGTGTSHGVPMIGCRCAVCRSKDARDKRTRTAIFVRHESTAIVIDTPPDFRTQILREGIERLDAVVYTHSHTDHIMGFDDLRRFCDMSGKPMPIHATDDVVMDLQRVFAFAFEERERWPGYVHPEIREIDGPFQIGSIEILPVRLPHGRFVVSGFILAAGGRKRAAYFTDCNDIPSEARDAARGVEVLILDALRHRPHPTHMNVEKALSVHADINPSMTYFTHIAHDLGHEETNANLPANVKLAFDGLTVAVP